MSFSKTSDDELAPTDLEQSDPGSDDESMSKLGLFLILASVFVAAACGIVYELLVGSISSYFLGNSVEQYSLTIGFFLFAMGLGSWISRAVHGRLIRRLVALEIWLGLFGGLTVPVLYLAYAYTDVYRYVMKRIWWAYPFYIVAVLPGSRQIFDWCYRTFATNRYRVSNACRLPGTAPTRDHQA